MKRALTVLALALFAIAPVSAHRLPDMYKVFKSVAKFVTGAGHCTAFSIDQGKALYATAAHCYSESSMKIDDQDVKEVVKSVSDDILIVQGGKKRPAIRVGQKPWVGMDVFPIGYGGGSPVPLFFSANVIHPRIDPFGGNYEPGWLIMNVGIVPGMSGGPIVNELGEVVSLNSITGYPDGFYQNIGGGVPWGSLKLLIESAKRSAE